MKACQIITQSMCNLCCILMQQALSVSPNQDVMLDIGNDECPCSCIFINVVLVSSLRTYRVVGVPRETAAEVIL